MITFESNLVLHLGGPRQDLVAKLNALSANRDLLAGSSFAMSAEEFAKAKLDIMTSRFG